MPKGNRGQSPRSTLRIDTRRLSLAKLILSIALGVSILAGVFLTNEQISSMLTQDVEHSKQVVTDSLHKLVEGKERRLETIASGIIGFYKASNLVEPDSFRDFVQGITRYTPDVNFIMVEDNNGKIIQSYPSNSVVGEEASMALGTASYVRYSEDKTRLLFQFPIDQFPGDQRKIVLAVEPNFFADPDEILGNNYKANIAVSSGESGAKSIAYQESELAAAGVDKRYENFLPFSQEEIERSIEVNIDLDLQGYSSSGKVVVLSYTIWHSSFEIHSAPLQYLSLTIGSGVAIVVTILLIRYHILEEKLRQNLDKLKEADRFKSDFINVASHELKTPIQPIILYAEMARKGKIDKDKALDVIQQEAKRLKKLANDILDLGKIEAGTLSYEMQEISINELLNDVVETSRLSIADKSELRIELDTDSRIGVMHADGYRLAQAVHVLISNAIKFTPSGTITITSRYHQNSYKANTSKNTGEAIIAVSDTGPGIQAEMLPRLFEKFSTMNVAGMNKNGTGLGLFIAKAIVEVHGGHIIGENNPNGVGARFEISLPVRETAKVENIPAFL